MKIFGLLLCCVLSFATASEDNENPVVHSPAGSFCGTISKSQSGKDIYTFRGIRYGKAPTGKNRFKATTAVEPHEGTVDATEEGPICPQPDAGSVKISEDCLRLDVYTTELPNESNQTSRPVLLFLTPGGIPTPHGLSYRLGPQFLLDLDVLFVSLNYRTGALGFLSTGEEHAPGNVGLKDQVLGLHWVQENIKSFGGDPDKVTLYGHGVSAPNVYLHMVSPKSKGLFSRILANSGAPVTQNPLPTNQTHLAKKQAELLECPTDNLDKMFDCLYEKSPEEFLQSSGKLAEFSEYPLVWTPVVEKTKDDNKDECEDDNKDECEDDNKDECEDDNEPFLTGQVEDLLRAGHGNFVPCFIGVNRDEYGFLATKPEEAAQCGDNSLYDEFNDHWEEIAPKRFGYESGTSRSAHISKELRSFYFDDEPLKAGSWPQLANLYADALAIFQVHRFQTLMATYSDKPLYYYLNSHQNCDSVQTWSNGTRFGTVHDDEISLLYNVEGRVEHCERDLCVANQVWELVVDFADVADPTPDNKSKDFPAKWYPSTKDNPRFLHYTGLGMEMKDGLVYEERMDKWDELFPIESAESTDCDD